MSLGTLFNVPSLQDEASFNYFSQANMDSHRLVTFAITAQKNINIDMYPLDPIPFFEFKTWLFIHQAWHNAINGVLGTSGYDLSDVDFSDEQQAAAWTYLHAQEHRQWHDMLRVM